MRRGFIMRYEYDFSDSHFQRHKVTYVSLIGGIICFLISRVLWVQNDMPYIWGWNSSPQSNFIQGIILFLTMSVRFIFIIPVKKEDGFSENYLLNMRPRMAFTLCGKNICDKKFLYSTILSTSFSYLYILFFNCGAFFCVRPVIDLLPWWVLGLLANASAENKMYNPEASFKRCVNLFWPYLNDKAYQQVTLLADDRLNSWDKKNLSTETDFNMKRKKADLFYKNCIGDNPDILQKYVFNGE